MVSVKNRTDLVPPDGGWGWMIIIAAGFSNLATLPMLQQFGLLFRDKFSRLGISSAEITTIININAAMMSCVGLANGPTFRRFTFRQVSVAGATVIFISLIMTMFSYNLITYLIFFSVLYGAGFGISSSANALALNTYWKERRRLATGLSWTMTGLGPIVWPQLITVLLAYFGEDGTTLLISGFSLHAIACGLLLHPVEWHAKKLVQKPINQEEQTLLEKEKVDVDTKEEDRGLFTTKLKNISAYSSQYLFNEDDPDNPGYEITDPGVPMMLRANDGYFSQSRGSKLSSRRISCDESRMNSKKPSMVNLAEARSRKTSLTYLNDSRKNSASNLGLLAVERETYKIKRINSVNLNPHIPESEKEDCPSLKAPHDLKDDDKVEVDNIDPLVAGEKVDKPNQFNVPPKHNANDEIYMKDNHSNRSHLNINKPNNFNYENEVLNQASIKLEEYLKDNEPSKPNPNPKEIDSTDDNKENSPKNDKENLTLCQKFALFFDLDLLKDFTFMNLMAGVTFANFSELNYSVLTPIFLGDLGLTKQEIAMYMSVLAGVDISMRFCVPMIAGKIGWHNNTFFLIGILFMAMGRVVLSWNHSFTAAMAVAVLIGFGKGLRTVFMALVIPTYVPLHKLPGASGMQLLVSGVVFLTLGPVVGWVKDHATTVVTLNCLNIFTYITAISWGFERFYQSRKQVKIVDVVL